MLPAGGVEPLQEILRAVEAVWVRPLVGDPAACARHSCRGAHGLVGVNRPDRAIARPRDAVHHPVVGRRRCRPARTRGGIAPPRQFVLRPGAATDRWAETGHTRRSRASPARYIPLSALWAPATSWVAFFSSVGLGRLHRRPFWFVLVGLGRDIAIRPETVGCCAAQRRIRASPSRCYGARRAPDRRAPRR